MTLLYRIVYAAHANGTHHKLALDALRHLSGDDAETWRRLFLAHAERYLEGAKAPDKTFKDFKNHVLHVGDDYWGGAIGKVEEWYAALVEALAAERWADAVYAAGVLSHYYTDPIHPFHTAQSQAESNIHRAAEWSINRSYDALLKIGEASAAPIELTVGGGNGWLRDLVCSGAETSHQHYERLIAHYDIHKGVVDPPDGLDPIAQRLVADLIHYASRGIAVMLDRAFVQSWVRPPEVALTARTLVAGLKMPSKWLQKRLANAEDRRLVQAMYDELKTTGNVEANLPEDDRAIRDLHAEEVVKPRAAARERRRNAILAEARRVEIRKPEQAEPAAAKPAAQPASTAAPTPPVTRAANPTPSPAPPAAAQATPAPAAKQPEAAPASPATKPGPTPAAAAGPAPQQPSLAARLERVVPAGATPAQPAPQAASSAPQQQQAPGQQASATPNNAATGGASQGAKAEPLAAAGQAAKPAAAAPIAAVPTVTPIKSLASNDTADRKPRIYLAAGDPIEAAPSIGPRMAERLAPMGILTVADFLAADPGALSEKFAIRQITAQVLAAIQAQCRLVMTIPDLRGTHAQLLVGAGYPTAKAVAAADTDALCAAVLKFASSPDGQRLLRDGPPPDVSRIKTWCENARMALAA